MLKLTCLGIIFLTAFAPTYGGAKTMRIDHGRPTVLVSTKSVLVLEFLKQSRSDAVSEPDRATRACHAQYRYRLFDGATASITAGEGNGAEILRTISRSPTGNQVKDAGSKTSIQAGEFHLNWTEATAGSRSWINYQADSPIRFLQQPKSLEFEAIGIDLLRQYYGSRNVQEFSSTCQAVTVLGPAAFSGDFPDETPVSARIASSGIESGVFKIRIIDLAPRKSYVIESTYDLKIRNWHAVHSFSGSESDHTWEDPLLKEVATLFYRIREGN